MSEFNDIEIYDYSTKSFVVRGETKQYRDSMVALGGKWNSRLTDKETGDRFGGWIFPAAKRLDVETWKGKGVHLEAPESKRYSPSRSAPTSSYSRSGSDNRELLQKMAKMEQRMAKLEKMMGKLLALMGDDDDEIVIESDGDDTDDREARKPRPRLMGGKKKGKK